MKNHILDWAFFGAHHVLFDTPSEASGPLFRGTDRLIENLVWD
jgi:hypothetical protein